MYFIGAGFNSDEASLAAIFSTFSDCPHEMERMSPLFLLLFSEYFSLSIEYDYSLSVKQF